MADHKERPILFSGPMVRAIREGRKTQTRRIVKPQPTDTGLTGRTNSREHILVGFPGDQDESHPDARFGAWQTGGWLAWCPYGAPGNQLWVRETWNEFDPIEIPADRHGLRAPYVGCQGSRKISWVAAYAADGPLAHQSDGSPATWRPSIHMPRWASRITLEITGVRVERLQNISGSDAIEEGIEPHDLGDAREEAAFNVGAYSELWESINGKDSWDANPWVWAVEFRMVTPCA